MVSNYGQSLPISEGNNSVWILSYEEEACGLDVHTFNPTTSATPLLGMQLGVNRSRHTRIDIQQLDNFSGSQQLDNPIISSVFDVSLGLIGLLDSVNIRPYTEMNIDNETHGGGSLGDNNSIEFGLR